MRNFFIQLSAYRENNISMSPEEHLEHLHCIERIIFHLRRRITHEEHTSSKKMIELLMQMARVHQEGYKVAVTTSFSNFVASEK